MALETDGSQTRVVYPRNGAHGTRNKETWMDESLLKGRCPGGCSSSRTLSYVALRSARVSITRCMTMTPFWVSLPTKGAYQQTQAKAQLDKPERHGEYYRRSPSWPRTASVNRGAFLVIDGLFHSARARRLGCYTGMHRSPFRAVIAIDRLWLLAFAVPSIFHLKLMNESFC